MKKGFTLVEVLAVIVIIGIISTIVGVSISGTIDVSKQKTYEQQVKAIEKAAQEWAIENTQYLSETSHYELSLNKLVESGKLVSIPDNPISGGKMNGTVTISYDLAHKQYMYTYNSGTSGNVATIADGKSVYFDPEQGKLCTTYTTSKSNTEVTTGCMKWYAFDDDGSTVKLILDHNTTADTYWGMGETPTSANEALAQDTSTWQSNLNARLISGEEVMDIVSGSEMSSASWLIDRISNDCLKTTSGACGNNAVGPTTKGYWTSSAKETLFVYGVSLSYLSEFPRWGDDGAMVGVRPVITVSNSLVRTA